MMATNTSHPSPSAASLAVLGTMSDAGKSIMVAGICRIFSNHGIRVAPFKGQNMSNNSSPALLPTTTSTSTNAFKHRQKKPSPQRAAENGFGEQPEITTTTTTSSSVTACTYGEIGTAQALQARACRILPRVEMNPVLLKSGGRRESDGAFLASVIVMGKQIACEDFGTLGQRTHLLLDYVLQAHQQLVETTNVQVVVLEGAGSCTELNLMERDIVNLPLVRRLQCPWILVANIDCGGVFAQIVGTKACLPSSDWDACVGIVVNKLRGEAKYFEPGPSTLQDMVGKPIFVVPFLYNLHLAEEDGLGVERRLAEEWRHVQADSNKWMKSNNKAPVDKSNDRKQGHISTKPRIVVIAYPHVSMSDEMAPVESDDRFVVQWRRDSQPPLYPSTHTVILPGSRLTRCDLQWLRESGWAEWILHHVEAGGRVIGICGGYQMLGGLVDDEMGVEGPPGTTAGLGLLPVCTVIHPPECKRVTPRVAYLQLSAAAGDDCNTEIQVKGYELHCGETTVIQNQVEASDRALPFLRFVDDGELEGLSLGRVSGTYLHGIFDSEEARRHVLAPDWDFGEELCHGGTSEEDELDRLARHLESCGLTFDTLSKMANLRVEKDDNVEIAYA